MLDVTCDGADRLTVEADSNGERRVLAGTAVPWDVVGVTSAGPTRFERGSVTLEAAPLLRDHDRTKAVGIVAASDDTPTGLRVRARVSRTPLGDETLTLADDGALTGFSIGVSPTEYTYEDDPTHGTVLVVKAGVGRELSVLPFPAFDTARVEQVAATAPTQTEETVTATTTDPTEVVEATVPAIVPTVMAAAPVLHPTVPRLTAGQVAHLMLEAQRGRDRAVALWEAVQAAQPVDVTAALDPHATGDASGIVPPTYTAQLIGGLPVATPVLSNLLRKAGLPATGMAIIKPAWGTTPIGDWVTVENAEAPSNPVTIGTVTVNVLTYAHAVLASMNLVNRSDFGGFANAYYAQVGIDYTAKKEVRATVTTEGAATAVVSTATTPAAFIGDLVAAQVAQQTNANGEFRGLMPEYAAVAPDVWSALVETKAMDGPAFSSGSFVWGNLVGSLSGLVVVMVPSLGAGHVVVGARAAVVLYDEAEAQLRAAVVSTLSVELGVIANCAFDVEYPKALTKGTLTLTSTLGADTKRAK